MKKHIKDLIGLQTIDRELQLLDQEIAKGVAELEEHRSGITARKASIETLQAKIAQNESRRRELEAETEDQTARLKDRQVKLMNVQTNREYQSLLREIEEAKKTNNSREEEIVRLMEQAEADQKTIVDGLALCEEEEDQLGTISKQIAAKAKEMAANKAKIEKERDDKAKKISVAHLKKYELLRAKRNGVAVVGVANGVCQGCYMNIPPQLYNDLLRDQDLLSCPTCNRMLYNKLDA